MSETAIYCVGKAHCELLGKIDNSWLSAMYIWNDFSKRYMGLPKFPSFNEKKMKRLWNINKEYALPEHEHITFLTTMDKVLVPVDKAQLLIDALEKYGDEHPDSTFKEQSEIIQDNLNNLPKDTYIGFEQYDCNDFYFDVIYDDNDVPIYHNLESGWNLFSQLESVKRYRTEIKKNSVDE